MQYIMQLTIQQRIKNLQQLKDSPMTLLKWDPSTQSWSKYQETFKQQPVHQESITTIAYNVLLDVYDDKPYKNHLLHSEERYTSILKDLAAFAPDVISLNEVTSTMDKMIRESEWVRADYWISVLTVDPKKNFSNLLLTKIKPLCYDHIQINDLPRNVATAFFHLKNKQNKDLIVTFSAVHLIAYSNNSKKRVQELTDLVQYLSKYNKFVDGHILQGDMNFHSEEENAILPKLNIKDAWLQKYNLEDNPGYTFDAKYNEMINEIYWGFEGRRMRLDRIFMMGDIFEVKEMEVILDKPIYGEKKEVNRSNFVKGGLAFLADTVFSANLWREKEKYLFGSDHFGLRAELRF